MPLQLDDPALLKHQCLVGGHWLDAGDAATINVNNPATGELIAAVPSLGDTETHAAIAAAERAFVSWKARTADQRAAILHKWFGLLMQHQEDLARIMTAEQGKPLAESRGEIAYAASYVQWFAEEARRIYGSTVPSR